MKKILVGLIVVSTFFIYTCDEPKEEDKDIIPPTVSIQNPISGQTINEVVTISVITQDNEGVDSVQFFIDDSLIFTDLTSPYQYLWNTTIYQSTSHVIKVISFDKSGNFTISQPVLVTVDNSTSFPTQINILSINYDTTSMVVVWEKSDDTDFYYYELYNSTTQHGHFTTISLNYDINDTSHVFNTVSLLDTMWFMVSVTDTLGLYSFSELYIVVEDPPQIPTISSINYYNQSFTIKWTQNTNDDFYQYRIKESDLNDMTSSSIVYYSNIQDDTVCVLQNIQDNTRKYYQVITSDNYRLQSYSPVKVGSSFEIVMFESNKFGGDGIYLIDIDGENLTPLTLSGHGRYPQFFPDGNKILYLIDYNVYTMNIDGSGSIRLTNHTFRDRSTDISQDGEKIVFHSNRDGNYEVYIMDCDGSNQTNLTNHSGSDSDPKFFPSGEMIVFVSVRNDNVDIYSININGNNLQRLTTNPGVDNNPSVSPDGNQIVFRSNRDDNLELYSMDENGNNEVRLTNSSGVERNPIFSPDGQQILYHYDENDDYNEDLVIMNLDGSNRLNITNNNLSDRNPSFSNDGSYIVYESEFGHSDNSEIHKINLDGTGMINISNDPNFMDYYPSIRPR